MKFDDFFVQVTELKKIFITFEFQLIPDLRESHCCNFRNADDFWGQDFGNVK